jgi:protein MAK16
LQYGNIYNFPEKTFEKVMEQEELSESEEEEETEDGVKIKRVRTVDVFEK